ncbi:MAG TPA: recombination mediator RecR [Acholeplasma sp.]|jgi:recombination protein RecR
MYPKILSDLIEDLKKLPGIGAKTAERLALSLINWNDEDLQLFGNHLIELKKHIKTCKVCGMITDSDTCAICKDALRNRDMIVVVADSKDVFTLEKMGTYQGLYHVLNGLVDFSRGVEPKDLNIESLLERAAHTKEIVLATNSTVEGELTAQYLKSLLSNTGVLVTRLGYGLPVGADLKYADELTLSKAIENRQKY